MKAIVYTRFGPPEVLQLQEVPKPFPKINEVLIKVYASTVTKEEPDMRRSQGLNGFFKPKNPILGEEFAGEIETVGEKVSCLKKGSRFYGITNFGAHAEYLCLREDQVIMTIPDNLTFEEAAAIPNGTLTALPFLRDGGGIQHEQKVLINGASGCVGSAAVQIAKYYGTEVTGVCSTSNIEMVKALGADYVIDYTVEDFTKSDQTFDIIFDAVGKSSFSNCINLLKSGGVFLTTVPSLGTIFRSVAGVAKNDKKVKFMATGLRSSEKKIKDLLFINDLIKKGKIKAIIDRQYPMDQIVDAHKYVELGHKKGNVIITHRNI